MSRSGRSLLSALALSLGVLVQARATLPVDGYLVAGRECPAISSIRRGANPGDVQLTPGIAYPVIGKNRSEATHYLLRIDGAAPQDRWVEVGCGALRTETTAGEGSSAGTAGEHVLAASWQPAFCQLHDHTPECESQTPGRYDAVHFSLHGLWPQPRDKVYCGVADAHRELDEARAWSRLPALPLSVETREELSIVMPGVASSLHRHEWVKHGSCFGSGAEAYYRSSLSLMDQLNASPVRDLFEAHIGEELGLGPIRDAFDAAFGPGAGARVDVQCDAGMISELRIHLGGRVGPEASLPALMAAASPVSSECDRGRVDAAGLSQRPGLQ
jgi:ribonuclease T2